MTSPSPDTDRERPKRAGLLLPWEIIVAPARAFERIAVNPEWVVAYIVVVVLMLAVGALEYPAALHVETAVAHATHQEAVNPHDFLGTLLGNMVVSPLIGIMFEAIAIAIFAATRDFKNFAKYPAFVSLAANTTIIWVVGEVIQATAIRAHDPNGFNDFRSLDMALPLKLTFLADPANPNQVAFLNHFGLFDTWASIVLSFGLARLANIGLVPALVFVFALDLAFAFVN